MLHHRKTWLGLACLVVLGCLLLPAAQLGAGDKKKEGKPGSVLSKNEVLKEDDDKDTKLTDRPRKVYTVKLTEGMSYQLDLKSKDFDTFLRLEDAGGKEVAFNDDASAETLDSKIVYKPGKGGDFKVIVTTFDGKVGKFALTVVEVGGKAKAQTGSKFQGKGMELKMKDDKASYTGEITEKDATALQRYYKLFTVQLEQGKVYRIDLKDNGDDPKFDPYLFLEDAGGTQLEADDDAGGGLNSRITFKAGKSGVYRIIATTLPPQQTGKFKLEISVATDAKEIKEADLKSRISQFGKLAAAERKTLVTEFSKHLADKGEDLSINDARLAFQLVMEAEMEDAAMARGMYKDYAKLFAGASSKQVASVSRTFESSLKSLERIGKEIEITGKTTDGKDFDLKNLKGKVVLVDFWATWCGPCIAEMPNMLSAYEKYNKKGFEIIGVSLDRNDEAITKFNEDRKIPWASINVEDSRKLADRYDVKAIPHPILVDQNGRVVSFRARGPALDRLLEKLFEGKK